MPPEVHKPFPGVLHIVHKNQSLNAKAFMRLQEFYESPLSNENGPFKGRHFSRDEFKKAYAASKKTGVGYGEFSYYDDWNGFNVPGDVVDKWLDTFTPDFMEEYLADAIRANREEGGRYYVIGTHERIDSMTVDHELSHAFWHLDPAYQEKALDLVDASLPGAFRYQMQDVLAEMGYTKEVFDDEIAAYLSTNNLHDTFDMVHEVFDMVQPNHIPWISILEFQQHFYRYKEAKEDEQE